MRYRSRSLALRPSRPVRVPTARNGLAFEQSTELALQQLGWSTQATKVTADWGADISAWCGDEKMVVQCKDWKAAVGFSAIKDVLAARLHYEARIALVVARNGFTRQAIEAAARFDVMLITTEFLVPGCRLDRTAEATVLREKRAVELRRAEEERVARAERHERETALEAWKLYDIQLRDYRETVGLTRNTFFPRWVRFLGWVGLAAFLSSRINWAGNPTGPGVALGVILGLIHAFAVWSPPQEPVVPKVGRPT